MAASVEDTVVAWRNMPAAAGHAEPELCRFKPPALWSTGMRDQREGCSSSHHPLQRPYAAELPPCHAAHMHLAGDRVFSSSHSTRLWNALD